MAEVVAVTQFGLFARYGIEKHRDVLDAFPQLRVALVMAPTYEEASHLARQSVLDATNEQANGREAVEWIHHPHNEESPDPMDWFGSWGAKWISDDEKVLV